ncbi:hypothetical protein DFH29DRAFT_581015 [Suillus ampliporus]|nr:hypothetical protein DFH29DRAFT_581015 [Suillus ampliporus]
MGTTDMNDNDSMTTLSGSHPHTGAGGRNLEDIEASVDLETYIYHPGLPADELGGWGQYEISLSNHAQSTRSRLELAHEWDITLEEDTVERARRRAAK